MSRVLLVEDDDALALALHGLGHEVRRAETGGQTLGLLFGEDTGVDVVLLGVMLPGIDGFEVCPRLRTRCCGSAPWPSTVRR